MGARKRHSPRRGSLAYSPRARAKSMEARIRAWPEVDETQEPRILAHCGFKAGCVQIVSIDDREKVPNAGKQLVSLGTVLATPPVLILGIRGYARDTARGLYAAFDVYAEDMPREMAKVIKLKNGDENALKNAEASLGRISELYAILAVSPRQAGLEQKNPYVFEGMVGGGTIAQQFEYLSGMLGKQVSISDTFEAGSSVDVAAITKGKGWQGVLKRWNVKKKQHKSRKTVREVGSLGPISPQSVMYTVPRAGQFGFHQRTEYNKRIMIVGDATAEEEQRRQEMEAQSAAAAAGSKKSDGVKRRRGAGSQSAQQLQQQNRGINPAGGYKHFGLVKGEYVILKGSVPGTYRRLVKLRSQVRNKPAKVSKPNILEVVV